MVFFSEMFGGAWVNLYFFEILQNSVRPQLVNCRMVLSTGGRVTIQWISFWETNCVMYWIEIYPVDSFIQLLNNLLGPDVSNLKIIPVFKEMIVLVLT